MKPLRVKGHLRFMSSHVEVIRSRVSRTDADKARPAKRFRVGSSMEVPGRAQLNYYMQLVNSVASIELRTVADIYSQIARPTFAYPRQFSSEGWHTWLSRV